MEFIDLKSQYKILEDRINTRISTVLLHGQYIMGPEVSILEDKLASYVDMQYCLSCSNGTDALVMLLKAWGIGPGDAVFVPSFTFMATGEAVCLVGATPVFVDVLETTFNIDPVHLEKVIQHTLVMGHLKPQVIIAVDLFGQIAEYETIDKIAVKYKLKVIEDAAQSFGAYKYGKKACSFGTAAITSFFPAKPLGCYGDGGAIFVNDAIVYDYLKSIRVHGQGESKYDNIRIGMNNRMDTIQAAVLLAKLEVFDEELEQRQKVSALYSKMISDCVEKPKVRDGSVSSWAQYTIKCLNGSSRLRLIERLKENSIPSQVYYEKPLHRQKAYEPYSMHQLECPVSDMLSEKVLCLPMHAYLDEMVIESIAQIINTTLRIGEDL